MSEQDLINIAETGVEAETFFRTKLGKYLLDRADNERANLITKLIDAPSSDAELNRSIRQDLSTIDLFLQWTSDAITSGRLAHNQMVQEEAAESNH